MTGWIGEERSKNTLKNITIIMLNKNVLRDEGIKRPKIGWFVRWNVTGKIFYNLKKQYIPHVDLNKWNETL